VLPVPQEVRVLQVTMVQPGVLVQPEQREQPVLMVQAGSTGPTGATGVNGPTGSTGATGATGVAGPHRINRKQPERPVTMVQQEVRVQPEVRCHRSQWSHRIKQVQQERPR